MSVKPDLGRKFSVRRWSIHPDDIPGLAGWWKLDESSGTLVDSSGSGNNGTASGGPTYGVAGQIGTCLQFDGVDDYVNVPDDDTLDLATGGTIVAWVKTSSGVAQAIASKRNVANTWQVIIVGNVIQAVFFGATNGQRDGTKTLTDGIWHHVAVVYKGSAQTLNVYVDGVLDNGALTGTVPSSLNTGTDPVEIARHSGSNNFVGSIDDLLIYNVALTPSQIEQLYQYR